MSVNSVILIGNLTREPELSYTGSGKAVCKFGVALNEKFNDVEKVHFFDVTVWGKQAESCNNYLKKGSKACVDGRLNFDSWEDRQTGQKRSKVNIVANRVHFLDPKSQDNSMPQSQPRQEAPKPDNQPRYEPPPMPEFNAEPEDDIPF